MKDKPAKKSRFKRSLKILSIICVITVIVFWIKDILGPEKVVIDSRHPEFPTGVFLESGKYRIWFKGGWNIDRHNHHPKSPKVTLVGPEGLPDWEKLEDQTWAFPELGKMATGLSIGSELIPAKRENIIDVKPEWLGNNVKLELYVVINDTAGWYYDNGPGIKYSKYNPVWRKRPYIMYIERLADTART